MDILIAMNIAFLINVAMMVMAAAVFFGHGLNGPDDRGSLPDPPAALRAPGGGSLRRCAARLWHCIVGCGNACWSGHQAGFYANGLLLYQTFRG